MAVYKRGDHWWINLSVGGQRIQKRVNAKNRAQAIRVQEDLRYKFRNKVLHIEDFTQATPFAFAAKKYLEHSSATKAARTYELDEDSYNNHLKPFFNLVLLPNITNDLLIKYQALKKEEGYSNRTINIHLALLRRIINFATDQNYCGPLKLKYPRLPEAQKVAAFLSPRELKSFISGFKNRMALLRSVFGIMTGLRPAELAYLTPADIDLKMKTAHIKSKPPVWIIKTKQERVVPLNKTALEMIGEALTVSGGKWVFSTSDRPVKSIRRAISTAASKAKLTKRITPNMLRHTFATHSLMHGADIKSVSELMGHSDVHTTMRYVHAIKDQLRKTVDLVNINLPQKAPK